MESFRLPFEISGLYAGCAVLRGMIRSTPEFLLLEYKISDTLIGAFSGGLQTREIAWTDIERAESGKGFFSPWLQLTARSMKAIDKLPCTVPGQVRFSIPWKHRRQVRAMASEINLMLSYREADRVLERLPGDGI